MNRLEVLIRSLQEHRASALAEIFHGPCTVDLGDDDITIAGIGTALDEEHIARQDPGIAHRIPVHLEHIRRFLIADEVFIERHRIGKFLVGRRGKTCRDCADDRQVRKAIQSRAFTITDLFGQIRLDGGLDVEKFIFRPGKVLAHFLFGPGRQSAMLSAKALAYDPYRQKWEKRLARYLSYQWRCRAHNGDYLQPFRVATLLDATGAELDRRDPARTRTRLEKALDTLFAGDQFSLSFALTSFRFHSPVIFCAKVLA